MKDMSYKVGFLNLDKEICRFKGCVYALIVVMALHVQTHQAICTKYVSFIAYQFHLNKEAVFPLWTFWAS
jgi:hypothetical protein